jgi:hypothetical protein
MRTGWLAPSLDGSADAVGGYLRNSSQKENQRATRCSRSVAIGIRLPRGTGHPFFLRWDRKFFSLLALNRRAATTSLFRDAPIKPACAWKAHGHAAKSLRRRQTHERAAF